MNMKFNDRSKSRFYDNKKVKQIARDQVRDEFLKQFIGLIWVTYRKNFKPLLTDQHIKQWIDG